MARHPATVHPAAASSVRSVADPPFVPTDFEPPITGAASAVTVTIPKVDSANTIPATIAFSGFMIEVDYDFPPIDDTTMKFTARIKVTGAPTFTDEAAS